MIFISYVRSCLGKACKNEESVYYLVVAGKHGSLMISNFVVV